MTTSSRRNTTDDTDTPERGKAAGGTAPATKASAEEMAAEGAAAGSGVATSVRAVLTAPATVARAVADDVVTTVRRPDAVLYLGGLVGLAVLGVLEWPVAAVAGVGVAVANGVRRARS